MDNNIRYRQTEHCPDIYNINLSIIGSKDKFGRMKELAKEINKRGFQCPIFGILQWTDTDCLYQMIQDAEVSIKNSIPVFSVYISIWEVEEHELRPINDPRVFYEIHTIGDDLHEDEHWTNDTDGIFFPNKYFVGLDDRNGEQISIEAKDFSEVKDLVKKTYPEVSEEVKDLEDLSTYFEYVLKRPFWIYYTLQDKKLVSPKTYLIVNRLIQSIYE